MTIEAAFKIATAIIVSLGGGAFLILAFSSWLGAIWAKRMLQSERAKHAKLLENIKNELDIIKQKDLTRHHDKLTLYRDIVCIISEILRELEAISTLKQETISEDVERSFSLNRTKAYGYISLVSSQEVMDRYNDMIDYFIPIIYEGKTSPWKEMRSKADSLLNSMRKDLGINDEEIFYRGER